VSGIVPALEVRNLRVITEAGDVIVDEVSFAVNAGEIVSVVGESGCGKTTTGLAILGYARGGTRIGEGSILLEGRDILAMEPRELQGLRGSRISYVPQDPTASLNPRHRVGDQIAEVMRVRGYTRARIEAALNGLCEKVQLPTGEGIMRRYPFELSGGQQQRVAIAMALACNPRVVVLDEPTTGLDVTTQARILDMVRELSQQTEAAFVYVTHDLAVVDVLAERVLVMYAGRIVEDGKKEQVFWSPAHPYTALLLNAVPRLAARRRVTGMPGAAPPPGQRPIGCSFGPRCPLADERCRAAFPPIAETTHGHTVRCWRASTMKVALSETVIAGSLQASSSDSDAVLAVSNLSASYGRQARRHQVLHDISFTLSRGECLALVGESGSGKTTIGRCIVGLQAPDAGQITLRGKPLARLATDRLREECRAIQIVFQNPDGSLNPSQTVEAIIRRPIRLFYPERKSSTRVRVSELLDRVRLPGTVMGRYPRELSGGEKQRVAVARALAAQPSVLVSDEITSSLDVSIQAAIVELLDELRRDGLALLFITHNLALVNSIADRVIVLERGELREEGATASVIQHPADAYTQRLIASVPDLRSGPDVGGVGGSIV